jgi:hypothetical protein
MNTTAIIASALIVVLTLIRMTRLIIHAIILIHLMMSTGVTFRRSMSHVGEASCSKCKQ